MSATAFQPLILAGMHRSGTSLAASILHAGGVNMGERLMGADHGNQRGHFENLDFFEFHRDVLEAAGLTAAGWVHDRELPVPAQMTDRAVQLLQSNAAHAHAAGWGWKDPRTTLFLEFWRNLAPEARFVFIYRSPWEVADSVFRRGTDNDQFFREDPADVVRVWAHYNQQVLTFMQRHPAQAVLVSNDAVCADPTGFVRLVNERFGMTMTPPPADIVDPTIMNTAASKSTLPQLVLHAFPEAAEILRALDSQCTLRSAHLGAEAVDRLAASRDLSDSFRDWFTIFRIAGSRKKAAAARTFAEIDLDIQWYKQKIAELEPLAVRTPAAEAEAQWHRAKVAELEKHAAELDAAAGQLRSDLAWHMEKVAALEPLATKTAALEGDVKWLRDKVADLERTHESLAQSLGAERMERIQAQVSGANLAAQLEAALRTGETLLHRGPRAARKSLLTREQVITVVRPADAPDSGRDYLLPGPFGAGRYALALKTAHSGTGYLVPHMFPGASVERNATIEVPLGGDGGGEAETLMLELPQPAAFCVLHLPVEAGELLSLQWQSVGLLGKGLALFSGSRKV